MLTLTRNPQVKPAAQPTTFAQIGWMIDAATRSTSNMTPLASKAASCHFSGTKLMAK